MSTTLQRPEEKTFQAMEGTLNYLEWGSSSAEPMVLLHGGAWRWQEYLSLLPALAEKWHTYAMDFRGNGRSSWVPETYRLQDFTEDNAQFLERLSGPAVLVGHSLGGVVALMLAAQCPDRVKALIIEDAPLFLDNYKRIIDCSRDMFGLWLNLKKSAHSEQGLALALADAYRDAPGINSAWMLFFAGCLWQLDPTFFDALLNDFASFSAGYDCKRTLATIDCPVLFLRGEARLGAVATDEETSWLQKNSSNVKCVLINGVGHLLHLEGQGQAPVLAAMAEFLEPKRACIEDAG